MGAPWPAAHDGPCQRPTSPAKAPRCGCLNCRARRAETRGAQGPRPNRNGRTGRRGARLRAVIEDYLELSAQGLDRDAIAARLGYRSRDGLDQAISRGRRQGLLNLAAPHADRGTG